MAYPKVPLCLHNPVGYGSLLYKKSWKVIEILLYHEQFSLSLHYRIHSEMPLLWKVCTTRCRWSFPTLVLSCSWPSLPITGTVFSVFFSFLIDGQLSGPLTAGISQYEDAPRSFSRTPSFPPLCPSPQGVFPQPLSTCASAKVC